MMTKKRAMFLFRNMVVDAINALPTEIDEDGTEVYASTEQLDEIVGMYKFIEKAMKEVE